MGSLFAIHLGLTGFKPPRGNCRDNSVNARCGHLAQNIQRVPAVQPIQIRFDGAHAVAYTAKPRNEPRFLLPDYVRSLKRP
jgi:hypothetical protein